MSSELPEPTLPKRIQAWKVERFHCHWLTAEQATALMAEPGVDTLVGLRDTAVLALMLCTGINGAEVSNLDVVDLRHDHDGKLALRVRLGRRCNERMIPYGEMR